MIPILAILINTTRPGDNKTFPNHLDTVKVNYRSYTENGTEFDSSYQYNYVHEFFVGSQTTLKGWNQAVQKMSLGEIARVSIPWQDAYGDKQTGNLPPKSNIISEIEIVEIIRHRDEL